jgi:hypothetical protein
MFSVLCHPERPNEKFVLKKIDNGLVEGVVEFQLSVFSSQIPDLGSQISNLKSSATSLT